MIQTENLLPGTGTTETPQVPVPEIMEKSFWDSMKGMGLDEFINKMVNELISFTFHLALAILVFYCGRIIIRKINNIVFKIMTRRQMDPSLTTFTLSLVRIVLYFILVIMVIGILGLETSSFLALFASAGVAMGMALSGTLQNFASGVLILLLKPYKVGDFIEAQGYQGTVKSIQLFNTVINTIDNKAIIIPNGMLSSSTINNYSLEQYRRVDWTVSLEYGTDLDKAKEAMLKILLSDKRIVKKYIEDDVKYRKELARKKELEKQASAQEQENQNGKKSLWSRLKLRRKKINPVPITSGTTNVMEIALPEKLDRSPMVRLSEMADSSINFTVRAWTHSSNYWTLYFDINERLYKELPAQGFVFPFPQLDVHQN